MKPAESTAPDLAACLEEAAALYRAALRASPQAIDYLRQRGIGGAAAANFGLGYAPASPSALAPLAARFGPATLLAAGLRAARDGDSAAPHFDRFRDRIVFPIRTAGGVLAGFGGRALRDGAGPKYINSPDAPHFSKQRLLYGLERAVPAIRAASGAVVVEGYFDAVALAQAGEDCVVATLGTACARGQMETLLALAPRIVFCFDGDAAGRQAAARAALNALPLATDEREMAFVFLPEGHDPDSLLRAHGRAAWHQALAEALPLAAFLPMLLAQDCDLQYAEGRALYGDRARPVWHALPAGEVRAAVLRACVEHCRVPAADLLALWGATD
ncbi:MAG: toprim domain-containing protein [Betaproteobacteria bacterium]